VKKGDLQLEMKLHFMTNWAQDDRVQRKRGTIADDPCDLPTTDPVVFARQLDRVRPLPGG